MLEYKTYKEHPDDLNRLVFYFFTPEQAEYFKQLLEKNNIFFTVGNEPFKSRRYKTEQIYYFIVKKTDRTQVNEYSLLTYARFRKPFISDKPLRILVILLFVIALGLAITGAMLSTR